MNRNLLDKNSSIGMDIGTVADVLDNFIRIDGRVLEKKTIINEKELKK